VKAHTVGTVSLLFLHGALLGFADWRMAPNKTEIGHMGAAVYFSRTLRFDVFRVNPPLTRMITALAVGMFDPACDFTEYSSRLQDRCEWTLGNALVQANEPETLRWCFAAARWSLIPIILLGGCVGSRLSGEMYGKPAAVVFLALWAFSPFGIGWGATICPDAAAASLGIVAVYTLRRWLIAPSWPRCVLAGACLGLLPLTKLTWIVAFGIWPMIWSVSALTSAASISIGHVKHRIRTSAAQLGALVMVALYTLNAGYLFDGTGRPLGEYRFLSHTLNGTAQRTARVPSLGNRFAGTCLAALPVPLPVDFVQGIDVQRYEFERGEASYLRGTWSDHGWWYYYLYVLVLRLPTAALALIVTAASLAIARRAYRAPWLDELLVLLPCLAIFFFVSSQTGFSAHPRYILPSLPLIFVAVSRLGRAFTLMHIRTASTVAGLLAYLALSSISIYPHSMSYFNELAAVLPTPAADCQPADNVPSGAIAQPLVGALRRWFTAGPRAGPRHLLGSNVDAGQDLFYLDEWCKANSQARPLAVAYFGDFPLKHTELRRAGLPPAGPDGREQLDAGIDHATYGPLPGWYALSVNEIFNRSGRYAYFLNFTPVAAIGHSIYVYHISSAQANVVRRKLRVSDVPIQASHTGK